MFENSYQSTYNDLFVRLTFSFDEFRIEIGKHMMAACENRQNQSDPKSTIRICKRRKQHSGWRVFSVSMLRIAQHGELFISSTNHPWPTSIRFEDPFES